MAASVRHHPLRRRTVTALVLVAFLALGSGTVPATEGKSIPSGEGWVQARSPYFTIYAEVSGAQARHTILDLERFRMVLGRILSPIDEADRVPTAIILFKTEGSFGPYRLDEQGNPMNIDGYTISTAFQNYIVLWGESAGGRRHVAYHEFVHQVLHAVVGEVPVWLDEGMAEFLSTFEPQGETGQVKFGHRIMSHLYYLERFPWIPWEEVVVTTTDSPTYNEGTRQGAFYAQSWLMARYLWMTEERIRALGSYLTMLRANTEPVEAMRASFGRTPVALGEDAERAAAHKSDEIIIWDLKEAFSRIEVTVGPVSPDVVLFRLGDLLARRGGSHRAAQRHLKAARDAGYSPAAIETALGICATDEEKVEEAAAHFTRAIDTGQAPVEAYYRRAAAGLEAFDETKRPPDEAPAAATEARRAARRAARGVLELGLARQPDHRPSLLLLARTYMEEEKTELGVAALDRARAIRPLDPEQLALGVCLLARGGRPAEAWGVIEGHIRPKERTEARRAEECLMSGTMQAIEERIEAGDREGARGLIAASRLTVPDEDYRSTLASLASALDSSVEIKMDRSAPTTETDRYNRAVGLARSGDLEGALREMEALSRECTDAEICRLVQETAASMRTSVTRGRQVARYNEAVERANAGRLEEALAILRDLERSAEDAELKAAIVRLRQELEVALSSRHKR